jgi:hypothetical protein
MKKTIVHSVLVLVFVFSCDDLFWQLNSLGAYNNLHSHETIQSILDNDIEKAKKQNLLNCLIISTVLNYNSLLLTFNYTYQLETSGHIQPTKVILRI